MLASGVEIPEASLQWVRRVHRACTCQVERHIDYFACGSHRLVRGELEAGSLL